MIISIVTDLINFKNRFQSDFIYFKKYFKKYEIPWKSFVA